MIPAALAHARTRAPDTRAALCYARETATEGGAPLACCTSPTGDWYQIADLVVEIIKQPLSRKSVSTNPKSFGTKEI
jgi:RecA-family ATPase